MNRLSIISLTVGFILLSTATTAQKNETPSEYYKWKGKKTEFQDGYVVLQSGKRIDGKISAKSEFSEITLLDQSGKEISLPAKSLAAFGLIVTNDKSVVSKSPQILQNNSPDLDIEEYTPENEDYLEVAVVEGVKNGHIILINGTRMNGRIEQTKAPALWYSKSMLFTDENGVQTKFDEKNPLDYFIQRVDDKELKFIQYKDAFAQVINEGKTFLYFRNPFPTTKNEFVSNMASAVGQQTIKEVKEISVYEKEYIIFNKANNKEVMVCETNYKGQIEGLLMNCLNFMSMEKNQQNELKKFKNIEMSLAFLNECY